MIALIDCNSFYASCEQIFRPDLRGRPVVVLSNNDGCFIALNKEAKALGFKRGEPAFKREKDLKTADVTVFSANFTLYGDISARIARILKDAAPRTEVYSIDESFLDLSGVLNLPAFTTDLRRRLLKWIGMPTTFGIGRTKMLAKVAQRMAKKENRNIYLLPERDEEGVLRRVPVEDLWGVGRAWATGLHALGCRTAWDFMQLSPALVKKKFTIVGYRMQQELWGRPMLELDDKIEPKQNICTGRSFGKMLNELPDIESAVAAHAATCAAKLRKQASAAGIITVFLESNWFRADLTQHNQSAKCVLPVATAATGELTAAAIQGLRGIFRPGVQFKKAGVILSGIIPDTQVQQRLFDDAERREKAVKLSAVMDKMNGRFGRNMLQTGRASGDASVWWMRQKLLSPRYSTRWGELPGVTVY